MTGSEAVGARGRREISLDEWDEAVAGLGKSPDEKRRLNELRPVSRLKRGTITRLKTALTYRHPCSKLTTFYSPNRILSLYSENVRSYLFTFMHSAKTHPFPSAQIAVHKKALNNRLHKRFFFLKKI